MKTLYAVITLICFLALASDAGITASSATHAVWIEGVLLAPDGHPACEGFVIVNNNPYLNALTDAQGKFRIDADSDVVPDALLASYSGSQQSSTPLEMRTCKRLTIRLQAQDTAFTKIEMGAALSTLFNGMQKDYYQRTRPFSDAEQQCVRAFQDFLKTRGEAIITRILAGTALSVDDERYRYLLHAELGLRAAGYNPSTDPVMAAAVQHYRDDLLARAKRALRSA